MRRRLGPFSASWQSEIDTWSRSARDHSIDPLALVAVELAQELLYGSNEVAQDLLVIFDGVDRDQAWRQWWRLRESVGYKG